MGVWSQFCCLLCFSTLCRWLGRTCRRSCLESDDGGAGGGGSWRLGSKGKSASSFAFLYSCFYLVIYCLIFSINIDMLLFSVLSSKQFSIWHVFFFLQNTCCSFSCKFRKMLVEVVLHDLQTERPAHASFSFSYFFSNASFLFLLSGFVLLFKMVLIHFTSSVLSRWKGQLWAVNRELKTDK